MISTSEYFDAMALDARRWPDHTDYYMHGPTRCALHVPLFTPTPARYVPDHPSLAIWPRTTVEAR